MLSRTQIPIRHWIQAAPVVYLSSFCIDLLFVTDEDPAQKSITDYPGSRSQNPESDERSQRRRPSGEDPVEFLRWIRSDQIDVEYALQQIPDLIQHVNDDGFTGASAGQCITEILEKWDVTHKVRTPQLLTILANDHVDTNLLIEHVLQTYPRDIAALDVQIDLDLVDSEELSHTKRMEGYRALSRLPPDSRIYNRLKEVTELFDGVANVGERYYLEGFFQTYSSKCLQLALCHPDDAPEECARKAITDHTGNALRVIASQPKRAVESGLVEHLVSALNSAVFSDDFHHGNIIDTLCEVYIRTESQTVHDQIGDVITAALSAGVSPSQDEQIINRLVSWLDQTNQENGTVLAKLFENSDHRVLDDDYINEIVARLDAGNPAKWVKSIRVLAKSNPEEFVTHTETLVTVARSIDGNDHTVICNAIESVVSASPNQVLPAIEPLVADIERAKTAREVEDIGKIMESAGVYPPPRELTDLYGSTDEEIDAMAKQVVASLRRQFRDRTPILAPGDPDSVEELSTNWSLVKRSGPVTWDSPSLDDAELAVVHSIVRTAQSASSDGSVPDDLEELFAESSGHINAQDDSIQFVSTSYDPRWIELVMIGAVFAQIVDPDISVVLHTPATGGWGTKKDIKNALHQYALAADEDSTDLIPLLDLIPTARISEGDTIIETRGTTVTENPPHLTLVRDIASLVEAPADMVLYNYLPGIDATNAAQLHQWRTSGGDRGDSGGNSVTSPDGADAIAEQSTLRGLIEINDNDLVDIPDEHFSNPIHVEVYSIFTAQYAAGRRQHIGPPSDVPYPVLTVTDEEETNEALPDSNDSPVNGLTAEQSDVDLHAVQSDLEIGEMLSKIHDYSTRMSDPEITRAIRRFRYTIGGLPVPVELHDSWIQEQIDHGNTWVPRQISNRLKGIEALADEARFDAQLIEELVKTIETLVSRLGENNPLFNELLEVLDEGAVDDRRVGILCGKKSYKDMLDKYLKNHASDWVLGEELRLLDDDTVRELGPREIDWLVTFDPLPPQTAIYYHHPAVKKTIVVGHADGTLESRLSGVESNRRPFLPGGIDMDFPELQVMTHGSTFDSSESTSFTDDLYRTFLSVAGNTGDSTDRQSGSSSHSTRYRLEFEEIGDRVLTDMNPQIVRSEQHLVSAGEYVLRSLSRVSGGDQLALVESDARNDLWEEFLRQDWKEPDEDVDAEETFIDAVELWYSAVSAGLEVNSDTSDPGDGIAEFARELASEVSVNAGAIEDWARSVYRADEASDLVFRSELRIGPRNADGIQAVAEAYGGKRMANNWEQVFTRIKAIRVTHRQRGSQFWQWLADRACSGELFDRPGVNQVDVRRCIELE